MNDVIHRVTARWLFLARTRDKCAARLWFPVNAAANQEQVGADRGAQWIMADANDWASLTVSNFTKTRKNLFGVGNYVQYGVTVTNTGVYPAFFALQGGGNT